MRDDSDDKATNGASRQQAYAFDGWSFVPIEEAKSPALREAEPAESAAKLHAEAG